MNYSQQTFGNSHDWAMKKMKAIITNPDGQITLVPFDGTDNKLALLVTLFPETAPKSAQCVLKVVKAMLAKHGECPNDHPNFWVWWIETRKMRVSTIHNELL